MEFLFLIELETKNLYLSYVNLNQMGIVAKICKTSQFFGFDFIENVEESNLMCSQRKYFSLQRIEVREKKRKYFF